MISWLRLFILYVFCSRILSTRLAIYIKVYRRRKPHGGCISRFTTRTGSECQLYRVYQTSPMSTFIPEQRPWVLGQNKPIPGEFLWSFTGNYAKIRNFYKNYDNFSYFRRLFSVDRAEFEFEFRPFLKANSGFISRSGLPSRLPP